MERVTQLFAAVVFSTVSEKEDWSLLEFRKQKKEFHNLYILKARHHLNLL